MFENNTPVADKQLQFQPGDRVCVLLPLPMSTTYDYLVPADLRLAQGDFVEVPLGGRRLSGVVWGPGSDAIEAERLKPVFRLFHVPALPPTSRRFIEWVAAYTVHSLGAVLKMTVPVPDALDPPHATTTYTLAPCPPVIKSTPARRRVMEVLQNGPPLPAAELAREAGTSPSVLTGLAEAGVVVRCALPADVSFPPLDWQRPGPQLSAKQLDAATQLKERIGGGFSVTLLDGVAGSGKTEIYFEAIAAALASGHQVLVLLPEIALGAQWLKRFIDRFDAPPSSWHSDLKLSERKRTWRQISEGRARVVVGARSALFLPFPQLGLIVVDEEHDAAFKQEDGVTYNARDMAVVRGRLGEIPVTLASATPALETIVNARSGRYHTVHLPSRYGGASTPAIEIIDLRQDRPPRGGFLAPTLRAALAETIANKEQSLLFLNRRGYAPLTLCQACGHRMMCPSCTAWLVHHRFLDRLQCHHCGYSRPLPQTCPHCDAPDSLVPCGPGVERVHEEVASLHPGARIMLATSDTLTGPTAAADLVQRIEAHDVDVIIGTQIVAKGYHFPLLTLVGVVDADLGLSGGELRASERTFQLLSQVAGRAGRAQHPGRAMLQTHMPDHPVIEALASADRDRFLAAEDAARRHMRMPPYGRLAALIVSGTNETQVDETARALAQSAPRTDGIRVLGPAPAPLALLRGRHRRRLLLHANSPGAVSGIVRQWVRSVRTPRSVRVQIDIDPMSFL